jgi:26S proteasome regulatory subunit T4
LLNAHKLTNAQLSDGFNGADLRNIVTEAGMFAIRDDRYAIAFVFLPLHDWSSLSEYIIQEDLAKAARKVGEAKKHETKIEYK